MVPKIIHYCWLSGDPIPSKLQMCMESWKKYLPDYEFVLWDKKRFDIHSVRWVEQAYNAKKYAFASDYIRLYAIYNYGGIYMDMDMEVLQPFKMEMFTNGLNMSVDDGGYIEGAFLAGEKGHPVLRKLMDRYENDTFLREDGTYKMAVINSYIENMLKEYGYIISPIGQVLRDCDVRLFETEFFNCRSLQTGKIHRTSNSYIIHWHTVLWASNKTRIIAWLRMKVIIPLIGERNYSRIQRFFRRDKVWSE